MSADLTPAEQARGHRMAVDVLEESGFAGSSAANILTRRADELDPPETVESLRAERDAALTEVERLGRDAEAAIRDHSATIDVIRKDRDKVQRDLKGADHLITKLRDERDEAWRECVNLQAKLDGREDTAAEREPRVWRAGDGQPEGVTQVRDVDGAKWFNTNGAWVVEGDGRTWARIAKNYAPLTEVLS